MVSAVRHGLSMREVARRFHVSLSTVQFWCRRATRRRLDRVDFADGPSGPARPAMVSGPVVFDVPHVAPADGYSVRLVASRVLYDHGTSVGAVAALANLVPVGVLRANPHDLDDLGVTTGGEVRLRSTTATLVVPVEADPSLPRKVVAADFNVTLGDGTVADLIDRASPVVDLRMESL